MADANDWNAAIIKEFRENEGRVGGMFASMPLLLLHHAGARTGTERVNPLAFQRREESFAIFASKGGAPTNPDWYHNLVANPDATIEVGTDTIAVRARVAGQEERDEIYRAQAEMNSGFAEYQANTRRTIPVVVLERTG